MRVIIDTGAFLALSVDKDKDHGWGKQEYQLYLKEKALFYTHNFILSEYYTRVLYDHSQNELKMAFKLIEGLKSKNQLKLLEINQELFDQTQQAMLKFTEHKLSFVDASIYVCVQKYQLDQTFTTDSGLAKIGLQTSKIA